MGGGDYENAGYLVLLLAIAVVALRSELDWGRFWRWKRRDLAEKKAEADRAERRKNGAGPWEV